MSRDWDESEHPRDDAGRFRDKDGWVSAVSTAIRSPEQDLLDLLGRAQRVRSSRLSGGQMAATSRVTLEDVDGTHHVVVHKSYARVDANQLAANEVVTAAIGQALGVRVPVTVLDPRYGGEALYMELLDGWSAYELVAGNPKREERIAREHSHSPSGRRLGLLDLLVDNSDRHAGNWLVLDDGTVAGIDHSHVNLAGREAMRGGWSDSSPFAQPYIDSMRQLGPIDDLSPAEAARIRRRLVALFERDDIRQMLIVANTPVMVAPPTSAQPFVDGLLRRWDAIAAMARGAD